MGLIRVAHARVVGGTTTHSQQRCGSERRMRQSLQLRYEWRRTNHTATFQSVVRDTSHTHTHTHTSSANCSFPSHGQARLREDVPSPILMTDSAARCTRSHCSLISRSSWLAS
jgi:hypothetical protein